MTAAMLNKLRSIALVLIALPSCAFAQDCATPTTLCAETINATTVSDPAPVVFECIDAQYTTYFQFTTNTNATDPGEVSVSVSNLECVTGGLNDTVQAVIVEVPPAGDPCVPASYVSVSDCVVDTVDFFIDSETLQANTDYLLVIGTNHDPAVSDCGFDVSIEGDAVDIDACCDAQIPLGQSETFTVSNGNAVPGYTWAPGPTLDEVIGEEVTATPEQTTTYTVTGTVGDCEVTDLVTLTVGPPVNIPNTITPNDDGINDLWRIAGISDFPQCQVTVYTRWGQVVYKDIGYAQPWDGTNRGKRLPTAAYYYVIELNSFEVEIPPITGTITLIH